MAERMANADVIVIGGGLAGLMAAVTASKAGARVLLLDKCEIGKSGASVQAKRLAAVGPWSFREDSTKQHLQDTLVSGCLINDRTFARVMVEDAEQVVLDLEAMGMIFDEKDASRYASPGKSWAGHSHFRLLQCQDSTGKVLLDVVRREAYRRDVAMRNDFVVTDLLVGAEGCYGAIGLDYRTGQISAVRSGAVIVATGGAGYLYARTSNPPQMTGDGMVLAYQAGAELMDLEMVQFYPTNYVYPRALEGKNVGSYAEAKLYNVHGERFMMHYDHGRLENTTRDRLAQAIATEIRSGNGTEHDGVFIDRTGLPEEYYAQFPIEARSCLEAGFDIRTQQGEVSPASHYTMGGIRTNVEGKTTVEGLFAAGEVATGTHGANRLADNSLIEVLVFGKRVGRAAARLTSSRSRVVKEDQVAKQQRTLDRLTTFLKEGRGKSNVHDAKSALRRTMSKNVGVIRSKTSLEEAISWFQEKCTQIPSAIGFISKSMKANFELLEGIELMHMLKLGELIARSALHRQESRGAHYREDFPVTDNQNWVGNVVIRKHVDRPEVTFRLIGTSTEVKG